MKPKRVIVAGSRSLWLFSRARKVALVQHGMDQLASVGIVPSVVISGRARGGDEAGEYWAVDHGVPVEAYPADWEQHGRAAGFIRNKEMAVTGEVLVALHDGVSTGTLHMITTARKRGMYTVLVRFDPQSGGLLP